MTPTSHKDRLAARALILVAITASVVTFATSVAPGQTRPSAATATNPTPAVAAAPIALPGGAEWLKRDSGVPAGKLNLSGTAHFIGFPCPADKQFLIAVDIYGSRYGMEPAMGEWQLTVCDDKFKTLFTTSKPYALFDLDTERWYRIVVPPLEIPSGKAGTKFKSTWINAAFDCKASRGVYVGYDAPKASNNSKVGMPDATPENTAQKYDWMVRPVITQNPPAPTPEMGYWLGAYYELRYEEANIGGMWSQPGFGAAVHFQNIPSDSVFQGFSLYAMRPDRGFDPTRSKIDFVIADDSGKTLTQGSFLYSQLPSDMAKWVEIESHKVAVPTSFWLVIDPHADTHKWVTFYYDTHTKASHAKIAAGVGKYRDPSKPYEWMIRAWVRRKIGAKEAN